MNTSRKNELYKFFSSVKQPFDKKIPDIYLRLKDKYLVAYYNNDYESAGIVIGKFVEVLIRYVQNEVKGSFTDFGVSIVNLPLECRNIIEVKGTSVSESIQMIIPRSLVFLYTIRNKRGIGHIGGDVEANRVDIKTAMQIADWIICEIIRISYRVSLEEAQDFVNSIADKDMPIIWEIEGKKRVLINGLTFKEKTLLLLYSQESSFALVEDLFDWVEYSSLTYFKQRVLIPLHEERMIEYNTENEAAHISPLGIKKVEDSIINKK